MPTPKENYYVHQDFHSVAQLMNPLFYRVSNFNEFEIESSEAQFGYRDDLEKPYYRDSQGWHRMASNWGRGPTVEGNNVYSLTGDRVGIGTQTPDHLLDIVGLNALQYQDTNEGAGKILTSDNDGTARWEDALNISQIRDNYLDNSNFDPSTMILTLSRTGSLADLIEDLSHTHEISEINNLQTTLNNKSNVGHTHVLADITDYQEPTLAHVSSVSDTTSKSLYQMTTNVDVEFKDSDSNTILDISEASRSVGVGTNATAAYLTVSGLEPTKVHIIGNYSSSGMGDTIISTGSIQHTWNSLPRLVTDVSNDFGTLSLFDSTTAVKTHLSATAYSYFVNGIGVGTSSPSATLDVAGTLQFVTGNEGAGKLLQSDANGNADWATVNLGDLGDVTITTPSNGEALTWDGSKWVNSTISGVDNWIDLTDTDPTGYAGSAGYLVRVNSAPDGLEFVDGTTLFSPISHTHALNDITDVTLSSPSTNDFLQYDGSNWVNVSVNLSSVFKWTNVTSNTSLNPDNGYTSDAAGTLTHTLPVTAAYGTIIEVVGKSGGWQINQNAGQTIHFGNLSTSTGTGGNISSDQARDSVRLLCVVADSDWQVISSVGNINIV